MSQTTETGNAENNGQENNFSRIEHTEINSDFNCTGSGLWMTINALHNF